MKAVILAGGFGTRISEETQNTPKPMLEIGGIPLLEHIMNIYSAHGVNEFIICVGYKGHVIKDYFARYYMLKSDVTYEFSNNDVQVHRNYSPNWRVTVVDTGLSTLTGGRIKRIRDYVKDDEAFCLTYGDGLSNVDISGLIDFHKNHGKLATLTAIVPPMRFGLLDIAEDGSVNSFAEKPVSKNNFINGGFFVLSPKVIDYIEGDQAVWEKEPLERLVKEGQMAAFKHQDFWYCCDTLRDKMHLEELWAKGNAPWKLEPSKHSADVHKLA